MYATAAGADTGVPKSVAREFILSDKPGKLPEHKRASLGGGLGSRHLRYQAGGSEGPNALMMRLSALGQQSEQRDQLARQAIERARQTVRMTPDQLGNQALERSVAPQVPVTPQDPPPPQVRQPQSGWFQNLLSMGQPVAHAIGDAELRATNYLRDKAQHVLQRGTPVPSTTPSIGYGETTPGLGADQTQGLVEQYGLGSPRLRLQGGGFSSFSAENPWWARSEARRIFDQPSGGGLVASSGAGRTDQIPQSVASDSHVLQADVISGLGQGNTLFGNRLLNAALRIGPYGTPLPQHFRGPGPPRPPAFHDLGYAVGGAKHDKASVLVAGGEYVIPREDWVGADDHGNLWVHAGVRTIGEGDLKRGHARLRDLTSRVRKHTEHFIKHAPPPKK